MTNLPSQQTPIIGFALQIFHIFKVTTHFNIIPQLPSLTNIRFLH